MPPEIADLLVGASTPIILTACIGIALSLIVTIGVTVLIIRMVRKTVGPDRGILQNGISAQAKILGVQQTGTMVNNQPQIAFTLEVHPPGGEPYQAQTKAVIPMVNIPQLQPGTEVPVKIHPTDPTKVVMNIYQ
jgi:hypothetical protein